MRIVHYYRDMLRPSGVTHAIEEWQGAVASRGIETLALHNGEDDAVWTLPNAAVRHVGRGRQRQIPFLGDFLTKGDVLILHEGWVTSNLIAAKTARRLGIPYVMVPHGVYEPKIIRDLKGSQRLRRSFESRMLSGAAAVHVFHEPEQRLVTDFASPGSFITLPTGFHVSEEARWQPGGKYLAWFGRYAVEHKGIDLMLASYALIPESKRLPLVMHGGDYDGGLRETEELVQKLGLSEWVTVGASIGVAKKKEFLTHCAGMLFPSRWESHSIALLEGLSLGVPILMNSSVHISPQLTAAGAVRSVDFTDFIAASDEICTLPEDDTLSGAAQSFVTEQLSWDVIVPKYVAALQELVNS